MIEVVTLLRSSVSDLRTTCLRPSASTSVGSAADSSLTIPAKTRPSTVATIEGR
jgi:hypothetical protein